MGELVIFHTAPRREANSRWFKTSFFREKTIPKPLWNQSCFLIDFWEHFLSILGVIFEHFGSPNPPKILSQNGCGLGSSPEGFETPFWWRVFPPGGGGGGGEG